MDIRPSRRAFLRTLGVGAAATALPSWEQAEAALSSDLAGLERLRGSHDTWLRMREQYLLANDVTYLNHASIGTVPRAIHEAQIRYLALCETNPWLYVWGGAWDAAREEARTSMASFLGCDPAQVVLTHNTTEAFNLLAGGLPLGSGDEVLFSSLNHDGASVSWRRAGARRGFSVREFDFPADLAAELTAEEVISLHVDRIGSRTRALVLPHLDNAVGIRVPLGPLVSEAKRAGVEWVLVDGAQTVGMIPLEVRQDGVDAYAGSPHKWLQTPKGLGVLYLSESLAGELEPMWVTWGQRRWAGTQRVFEDYGTRNLAEVLTLSDAAHFHRALSFEERTARLRSLHGGLQERVAGDDELEWRSPLGWEAGGSLISIGLRTQRASAVAHRLYEQHGIIVRGFETMRLNALRVSPNTFNTVAELDRFVEAAQP